MQLIQSSIYDNIKYSNPYRIYDNIKYSNPYLLLMKIDYSSPIHQNGGSLLVVVFLGTQR